jgi:transcription-repair coupling factor (superfamily II helicase)
VQIQFGAHPAVDPGRVIELVQTHHGWKLAGPTKLRVATGGAAPKERARAVRRVLEQLAGPGA